MNQNDIALIGEAWGEEEDAQKRPFVGRAGEQLNKLLGASGIDRSLCYVTNVLHERPAANDFGVYYEDKSRKHPTEYLKIAHKRLISELLEKKVKVAVCLGNEPLFALFGLKGIESWRGSILHASWGEVKIIPTFHPSAVMRIGGASVWYLTAAIKDLKKAVVELDKPFPILPRIQFLSSSSELSGYFSTLTLEDYTAIDIEVMYKYGGETLASIAFSNKIGEAVVVPFIEEYEEEEEIVLKTKTKIKKVWKSRWKMPYDEMQKVYQLLNEFFINPILKKVGQNFQFDINTLKRLGIIERCEGFTFDTLVAHSNCVDPEFPHDLGFLCSWYTRYPYYKHMLHTKNEDFWTYNGYDAAVTREIMEPMLRDMERNGMRGFYFNTLLPLFPCISEMNYAGIKLDKPYQENLRSELNTEIKTERAKLDEVTQGQIENHRSPKQVAKYLYEIKGYEPICKRKTKTVTTDEVALKQLDRKIDDPALKVLLKLRELEKMLSSYAQTKTDERGFVRTTYLYAKTGRFRSGKDQE